MSAVTTAGATTTRRRGLDLPGVVERLGAPALSLLVGAAVWEAIGRIAQQSFFPPFSVVFDRMIQMMVNGEIPSHLVNSLVNLCIGFGASVVIGVTVGGLMGVYRKVDMALDSYVYALLTAPTLVFAPLFFSVWGLSGVTTIAIIVMYTVFIIIVNTSAAIRGVQVGLVEMGRSYCASERQLFFKIILPAALPLIMAGLRLGMGRSVKGMINGEMFIAFTGLGAIVESASGRFDAPTVLAVLMVIIIVAMVAMKVVQVIDNRLTGWLPSTARTRRRA